VLKCPHRSSWAAAAAYVKAETAKWKPVVAQLGTALGQ